ncbi:MAG: ammonium transporter [Flavobacteriaceae bacterium]|nr:ammonium transporter [Flavobacteriaceae bacterium]MCY4266573.1 ammonium transporter [Flavobacteriaceae bacterium]MCY4297799.1 ammonium transporter [Flavobacteriaceae bacterium]
MEALFTANNVWMMICTALVFIMHLGFGFLEMGLTRQKNAINIFFKNFFVITMGILVYYLIGFNLMYPGFSDGSPGIIDFAGFGLTLPGGEAIDYADGGYTYWTDFLFQAVFAATAATIVSGAVAERVKIEGFMIFSLLYVAIAYPIVGSWQWGGGWLSQLGFHDFAGSTLVHSVGGWAALMFVYFLGPRIGKYENGRINALPGHNLPLAAAGVLILWLGWFGFNGGSILSAEPTSTSLVLVNTCLAASAGAIVAFIVAKLSFKSFDLTMFMNGVLGGLVGITAGADQMNVIESIVIGGLSGVIVVYGITLLDKALKLDDPVGAIAVHLICGIWGTLAVGLFGNLAGGAQFLHQAVGVGVIGLFCVVSAIIFLFITKYTVGIRAKRDYEIQGLDCTEHAMDAYSDFQTK